MGYSQLAKVKIKDSKKIGSEVFLLESCFRRDSFSYFMNRQCHECSPEKLIFGISLQLQEKCEWNKPVRRQTKNENLKLFQAHVSLVEVADVVHHLEGKLEILSSHISCQIPDSCRHVNGGSRSKKQKIFQNEGKLNR